MVMPHARRDAGNQQLMCPCQCRRMRLLQATSWNLHVAPSTGPKRVQTELTRLSIKMALPRTPTKILRASTQNLSRHQLGQWSFLGWLSKQVGMLSASPVLFAAITIFVGHWFGQIAWHHSDSTCSANLCLHVRIKCTCALASVTLAAATW